MPELHPAAIVPFPRAAPSSAVDIVPDDEQAFVTRVGQAIATERQRRRWSQRELAMQAQTQQTMICRTESPNGHRPSLYLTYKIATALGLSLDGLCRPPDLQAALYDPRLHLLVQAYTALSDRGIDLLVSTALELAQLPGGGVHA